MTHAMRMSPAPWARPSALACFPGLDTQEQPRRSELFGIIRTTSGQLKISNRDFSKTAGLTPIFEARIVIYDQIWAWNSVFKTFSTETLSTSHHVPYFLPLSRALTAMARRGGTSRPKATARFQQL